MPASVLADTGPLLALSYRRDQYHGRAVAIARRYLGSGGRFVSTLLVLAELQAHLLFRRGPDEARQVVAALLADPAYEWVDVTASLARAAHDDWLARFGDQRFSLTDAVSFAVMKERGLRHAFAFDDHFVTAGFATLR